MKIDTKNQNNISVEKSEIQAQKIDDTSNKNERDFLLSKTLNMSQEKSEYKQNNSNINITNISSDKQTIIDSVLSDDDEFSSDSYNVKLDQFEGPLDLLLHLIKDAKIDIKDIFVSKITDQYLKYIEEMKDMPMEKVGDFIEMAATLLEIKSKKLLPVVEEVDPDEETPEQKLIRQLEEYKLFKEATEKLKVIEDVDKFYKEPEPSAGDFRYILKDIDFSSLLDAFSSLMHKVTMRAEIPVVRKIVKDRFTVAQKIAQIKDTLMIEDELKFTSLFEKDYSKSEIINTFLAVLELLKHQYIHARQEQLFDEIFITKNLETKPADDVKLDINY